MNAATGRAGNHGTLLTTWTSGADMSTAMRVAAVFLIAAATAAGAQMSVHLGFTPVPLVMQDMVVLLALLGRRAGRDEPDERVARVRDA